MNTVNENVAVENADAAAAVQSFFTAEHLASLKKAAAIGIGAGAAGYAGLKLVKPVAEPVVKGGLLATGALLAYEAYSAIVG